MITPLRIVCAESSVPFGVRYATDAALRGWTADRLLAHRFADGRAARTAIEAKVRGMTGNPDVEVDPYHAGSFSVLHPTSEDAALAFTAYAREQAHAR